MSKTNLLYCDTLGKTDNAGILAFNFYVNDRLFSPEHLKQGSIVIFHNGVTKQSDFVPYPSCEHVGLCILTTNDGCFYSIEGNVGKRGDHVDIVKHSVYEVSCVCNPDYKSKFIVSNLIDLAINEIGVTADIKKRVKYNTEFYGAKVGAQWCVNFIWWLFNNVDRRPFRFSF